MLLDLGKELNDSECENKLAVCVLGLYDLHLYCVCYYI